MAETTTDHDTIRRWAEEKGGRPAAVAETHTADDAGLLRVMFPDAPQSENEGLTEIGWDEFFDKFEEQKLALVYEEDSMFSKVVSRNSA